MQTEVFETKKSADAPARNVASSVVMMSFMVNAVKRSASMLWICETVGETESVTAQ